ncbi:MAG: hypothetical protein RIS67_946, partial [Pseudomonadota bacterium]
AYFMGDAEVFKMLDRMLHGFPIAAGAHNDANQYRI